MVRMQSCYGNEFTPIFHSDLGSDQSEKGSDESGSQEGDDIQEGDSAADESEQEDLDGAFADAKDRWKIDAETLKGFYLHSPTGQLFSWDQARGVLYEYIRGSGECRPIWAAGAPHLSSEIWTVLPLPPTDPASLQTSTSSSRVLCILHLSRARAAIRAAAASADFCERLRLNSRALDALLSLPPPGQAYVLRTFCAPHQDPSGALRRQVEKLQSMGTQAPYASAVEEATLRVPASGAILGRCVPEIAALCWNETDPVAAAHCRIAHVDGVYSVCDLGADEDGTLFDGRRLGSEWCPLKDGCDIDIGPIRMHVELKPVTADGTEDLTRVGAPDSEAKQVPQRGSWRAVKRGAAEPFDSVKRPRPTTPAPPKSEAPICVAMGSAALGNATEAGRTSRAGRKEIVDVPDSPPLSPMRFTLNEPVDDLLQLQRRRAHCPSLGGAGRAFWAVPRDPSPEPSPDWVPKTP